MLLAINKASHADDNVFFVCFFNHIALPCWCILEEKKTMKHTSKLLPALKR